MKKLFMGAIALSTFAIAICLVQISCSKTNAQTSSNAVTQLNKIIYKKFAGTYQLWTANYDGSNQVQIPITLPPGLDFTDNHDYSSISISPDGQTVFFVLGTNATGPSTDAIYSCPVSGGSATMVIPSGPVGKVAAY